jgi:hypothetical protein
MGSCLMVVACTKHLQVPIVPLHCLCDILSGDTSKFKLLHRQWMTTLHDWFEAAQKANHFCRDDRGHVTCYISSSSDENGEPCKDKICMLHVKRQRVYNDNVAHAIGVRVKDLYGSELVEACHMGPEPSIYGNAMQSLISDWSPDFRQMYGNNLYAGSRHVDTLQLSGAFSSFSDWTENEPPVFAKVFNIMNPQHKEEILSCGIGINVWGLLLMASLGATTFHPHVVSDISRTLIADILNKSPVCATPGNTSLVRSFHLVTTGPERIKTSAVGRPMHFPRPVDDLSFASTGAFFYFFKFTFVFDSLCVQASLPMLGI